MSIFTLHRYLIPALLVTVCESMENSCPMIIFDDQQPYSQIHQFPQETQRLILFRSLNDGIKACLQFGSQGLIVRDEKPLRQMCSSLSLVCKGWLFIASQLRFFLPPGTLLRISQFEGLDVPFSKYSYLNLSENKIATNDPLRRLINLTDLNLGGNNFITDEGLGPLTKLASLKLAFNKKITNGGLFHLTNLTKLGLGHNKQITNEILMYLTDLTDLDLSANITITDEGVSQLTNLTKLDLYQGPSLQIKNMLQSP